jgi:DNA-directed RNA polymerase subunit RPC12/RpoP
MKNAQRDHTIKCCPDCGQQLRIPENTGGITLKCPSCGHRFASDFKIGRVGGRPQGSGRVSIFRLIFEFPGRMFDRLFK